MWAVLGWWVIVEVIGLLALPIALRLFRFLPERGYAFSKQLGLLLCGYLLWIGCSFHFLSNTRSAILFVMLLVGAVSAYLWSRDRDGLERFWRENRRTIIATELVFTVALVVWAIVRAYNPDIAATEKPMEIGFLNAILRSQYFPPHDPWLSGFAISYYYFGYLIMAMLTKLSGVAPSVAFNLAISLLFALTAAGAFGLVYNLLATDMGQRARRGLSAILWSLLGPLFVLVIGNLEGFFEVLHTRGLGSPAFWKWLDVQGLIDAPVNRQWVPTDSWWWWRASRVVNDRDLQGGHMEVIDEFPQFSFLLGDMHPHVLNLPFVLLACALALNVLLGAREWVARKRTASNTRVADEKVPLWERWPFLARAWDALAGLWRAHAFDLVLLALCLGAMGFLNTWDLPIYLFILVVAFFIGQRVQRSPDWLLTSLAFAISVAVPAALLYLPFYLSFQSQAGGVLPELFNTTRLHQYLLMFGLFVFVIASLIVVQIRRALTEDAQAGRAGVGRGFLLDMANWLLWLVAGPLLLMALAVLSIMVTKSGRTFLQGVLSDARVKELIGNSGVAGLLRQALLMRLGNPGTFLLAALLMAALLYLLQRVLQTPKGETQTQVEPAMLFVYLIAGVAFLLTLGVEFVYLRDSFGSRMNTVFKFYYQAWVLMAIAAAYGIYYLLGRESATKRAGAPIARSAWLVVLLALVAGGMCYPLLGIPNKAGGFRGKPSLDGMAFLANSRPDDYAAILWLQQNEPGMANIVEAWGGSYSDAAFTSAFTGLPTVLGWDFHEFQWRGNSIEGDKRKPDIATIYQNSDAQQVLTLLEKYDIRYVYVGATEARKYELPPHLIQRFGGFLEKVYEQGSVAIYRR
jgi:YYY domain-containing protein